MELKDEYTTRELSDETGIPSSTLRAYVQQGKLRPTGKKQSTRGKPSNVFNKHEVERFLQWRYGGKRRH